MKKNLDIHPDMISIANALWGNTHDAILQTREFAIPIATRRRRSIRDVDWLRTAAGFAIKRFAMPREIRETSVHYYKACVCACMCMCIKRVFSCTCIRRGVLIHMTGVRDRTLWRDINIRQTSEIRKTFILKEWCVSGETRSMCGGLNSGCHWKDNFHDNKRAQ